MVAIFRHTDHDHWALGMPAGNMDPRVPAMAPSTTT
jgi:hypothetical protein